MRGVIGNYLKLVSAAAAAMLFCASFPLAHADSQQADVSSWHPNFSGVWTTYIEPGARPNFRRRGRLQLPFTPLGKRKVDAYQALVRPTSDNPGAHCLGSGMPAAMMFSGGYPMEIVQTPDLIVVLYEAWSEIRQLYLGDKIIAVGDRIPDREGYSAAHWEGDTLVVVTTELKEQEDQTYPHSANARIVERYHLAKGAPGEKVLEDDWTMTDPVFYTHPVKAVKKWALDPKGILLPYECDEEGWLDHLQALSKAKGTPATVAYK
jgi:hypothetical protein